MSQNPTLRAVPVADQASSLVSMAQMVRRFDGWSNLLTGLGTARDKRTAGMIKTTERLPYEVLVDLYRSEPFAAKIVDRPVEDMTRKWFETRIEGEKSAGEDVDKWLQKLEARAAFALAAQWMRAYGGAGILLGINGKELDSRELSKPLDPASVKEITHLTVFSCRELQTVAYYSSPQLPNFGKPAIFRIVPQVPFGISGQRVANFGASYMPVETTEVPLHPWSILPEVHESRVLQFDGVVVDRRQRLQNWGWGDSVIQRVYELLRDFGGSLGGVSHLLQDFAQAILKVPGLTEAVASDNEGAIVKRAELLDMTRSIAKMILLDGGEPGTGLGAEEFKRETTTLTGVPESIDRLAMSVAAAADMPVTLLFGQSPKGLGNEGDSDVSNWDDHVAHKQQSDLGPNARRLVELGLQASKGPCGAKGAGLLAKKWSIEFLPLRQPTDKENAEIRKVTAETDEINIRAGVLSPEEARESHFGGDSFSQEIQLDSRDAFNKTDPAEGQGAACPECGKPCEPGKPCPDCGAMCPVLAPELEGEEDPAMPIAGAPAPAGAGTSPDLQATALNGAQITGMLAIVQAVADGTIPPDSAKAMLVAAFPLTIKPEDADAILKGIEVKPPPEPPDPIELAKAKAAGGAPAFGGPPGAPPPKPGAKPPPTDRQDFDEDQPRDEDGKWSGEGAGGGSEKRTTEGHLAHALQTKNVKLFKMAHAQKMRDLIRKGAEELNALAATAGKEIAGKAAEVRRIETRIRETNKQTRAIDRRNAKGDD